MSAFDTRTFGDGERLFGAGDPADSLYVVQSGEVRLLDGASGEPFATVGPGASFGEQALLPGGLRTASARAVGAVTCLVITADSLRAMMRLQSPMLLRVLEALLLQQSMHNALRKGVTCDS